MQTLLLFKNKTEDEMVTTLQLAIENKTYSKESISMMLSMLMEEHRRVEDANTSQIVSISDFSIPSPDVAKFDRLLGCRL